MSEKFDSTCEKEEELIAQGQRAEAESQTRASKQYHKVRGPPIGAFSWAAGAASGHRYSDRHCRPRTISWWLRYPFLGGVWCLKWSNCSTKVISSDALADSRSRKVCAHQGSLQRRREGSDNPGCRRARTKARKRFRVRLHDQRARLGLNLAGGGAELQHYASSTV